MLSLGERSASGALASWFWADSRQQLSGLSLALMALLLALAVNVGVATMVETFSKTFLTWLDGRLAADVYVSAADNAQADAIKAWLRGRSEVQAVLAGGRAEIQIDGAPAEVLGLPDDATYRDHWPLLQSDADAWAKLPRGETAFISEQLSRRMNLSRGDRLVVPTPDGDWPLQVAGIYADYGNPRSQVAVNAAALFRHFPATPQTRLALRVERAKIPALITALSEQFGLDGRNLLDQAAREGGIDAHLQPHLRGHRRAERLHAGRRRRRAADQPVDARQFAPAAARAALGGRRDAAEAGGDRADQDDVGRVHHRAAGAAARAACRLVPDRHRQCEGVRLAAAVPCLPAATRKAARRCAWRHRLLASLLPVARLARMQPADLVKVFANER